MSEIVKNGEGEESAPMPAGAAGDALEVRIAAELLERAKAEGVSLVAPAACWPG